ncbi:hypothetical protein JCM33374_g378 [Metschnikowia sp. JCM 33374]|nr:hypothetical protein JCM33374_g378 [Metschnikowia sp. JCM 33374]
MDIFRILSRGASVKSSKKASADFSLPSQHQTKAKSIEEEVEKETDFFRTHGKNHRSKSGGSGGGPETPAQKSPSSEAPHGDIQAKDDAKDDDHDPIDHIVISNEEEAADFRKRCRSKVTGNDVPLPIASFQDLVSRFGLNKRLRSNLLDAEFVEPTPIQCEAIPISLQHRDVIACAPTGSGKTLAFLIPMIQTLLHDAAPKNTAVRGLIIAPTNELASQIHGQLQELTKGHKNLPSAILSRQLATRLSSEIVSASKYAIIVSTPLRLIDVVKAGHVDLSTVEELVIDEADRLFDRGFVEQTDAILAECTHAKLRKSIFSATIPAGVEEMANSIMKDQVRIIVGHKEAASSTIDQKLVFTGSEEGKLVAIRQMIQQGEFKPPIIIFLQSITRAKALFHELLYDKLNVDVIHAERTPKQRDEVIKRFKNGDIWVLITTDVLARGVDFKGVNLVINYDVPQTAQAYVHRIGRTGRGGKAGKAVTFFTKEDNLAVKPIINVMKQSGSHGYSDWMENMSKLTYQEKKQIRRKETERKQISTVPKIVKQKRKQRQEMIDASKRRKQKAQEEAAKE